MEPVLLVMPLTRLAVDALGVVTICLVSISALLGLFCIAYTLYLRARIQRPHHIQLGYFNGPWIVRITYILFGIWWGVGEIVRLSLFRQKGRPFSSLGIKWQENLCKYYILSNLGFAEPCLFLTMSFLLRASLQWRRTGILTQKWNFKTATYILLYCFPIFLLDAIIVIVGLEFRNGRNSLLKLPDSFTRTYQLSSVGVGQPDEVICSYPLLCTIVHGLFAAVVTIYLLLLGRRMVSSVINKGLQRRVYILIFLVSSFLPLRVILLGFSVLAKAHFLFEALAFGGFLVLLSCVVVGIFILVYLPVADSLAVGKGLRGGEAGLGRLVEDRNDSISLIASNNQGLPEVSTLSLGRNSDASTKRGSISFRTMIGDEASTPGLPGEEMSTFSTGSHQHLLSASAPGSPAAVTLSQISSPSSGTRRAEDHF